RAARSSPIDCCLSFRPQRKRWPALPPTLSANAGPSISAAALARAPPAARRGILAASSPEDSPFGRMTTMHRLLLLALFFGVALDFPTPDAVLAVGGARSVQWDDEEESVPARRQRVDGEERRVAVFPVAPHAGECARRRFPSERRLHVAQLNGLAST